MGFRWVEQSVSDPSAVDVLCASLNNLPRSLGEILVARNIDTFEAARLFFRPTLDDLHDPFLMKDMDVAAERVARAIKTGEKVLVYGDYDVDGTTSTSLMVGFLQNQGLECAFFIPDRYKHGYGLCKAGIDFAKQEKASLVIALDCGITGHEVADYVTEQGMELIICDHHTAEDTIPNAVAVLDPKRPDCPYPFKELTGCGVGFKLIQASLIKMGKPAEDAYMFLDLVALAIASDIVPILGENRVLMHEGLNTIRKAPRLGLKMLAQMGGIDLATCSTSQIVFGIGPRINAAGRMDNADLAVELLTATDAAKAYKTAESLENLNKERRQLDNKTYKEAIELMESRYSTCTQHAIVLHEPRWHLGIIGIVASRLVEHFHRPTILLSSVNGYAKGSARSITGYNIYDAIKECEPMLTKFGGHAYAAGLTLPEENIADFRDKLNDIVRDNISPDLLMPEIKVDAHLNLDDLTARFWRVLDQFSPFGPENRKPVFHATNLSVVGKPTLVGNDGHLKFWVRQSPESEAFEVIGFGLHDLLPVVRESSQAGKPLEMLFCIEENAWNGTSTLQLRAKDVRIVA
jgi:single-stranded-DNA-specific exonuclease